MRDDKTIEAGNGRRAVLWGGLTAGILDITFALTYSSIRGMPPIQLLQSVASGLLGQAAFDGGWRAAGVGLLAHFTIAFGVCTVFYLASRRLPLLSEHPVVSGALYGIAVYFFMQLVVLPLSAVPWEVKFSVRGIVSGFAAHIFCIGLPIAFVVRHFGGVPRGKFERGARAARSGATARGNEA